MNYRDFRHCTWTLFLPLLLLLLLGLVACDRGSQKPAPIGDHAVLEQLAAAYRTVAEEYPVQPASMRPVGKKEFVDGVFKAAGYDYSATLTAFAKQGVEVTNQDQRDLAELLFLPHKGLAETELVKLYSTDELAAIRSIQASLR